MSPTTGFARLAVGAAAAAAAFQVAPVLSSYGPLRRCAMPRLSGTGRPGHVALTFDDGPDPVSTPYFLRLLDERGIKATFFVLGSMAAATPELVSEIVAAGHEIAIHGWRHRPLVLRGPRAVYDDLARARDLVAELSGEEVRLFRPPYGVMTGPAHLAARRLGLTPVLWTTWGEDWKRGATPDGVAAEVLSELRDGGTILLHDSDCTSTPASWRATLGALPRIMDACEDSGWKLGPLREHCY
jgi:peptidoglycan/xylan/chitin deacetylase (PgdA/CDA1 family)